MGWFSTRAPVVASDETETKATAAVASTSASSTPPPANVRVPAAESKAKAQEKPTLTEAEQLDLLVGGVRLDDTEAKDKASFLRSNQRHMYLDGFLSCAAYTFSGLQHIQGQSNALTLLTMWTVGTTFLVDAGERKYLQDALQGTLPMMQKASEVAAQPPQSEVANVGSVDGTATAAKAASAPVHHTLSSTMVSAPLDASKLADQQRKIFLTQTVASWVWMLASFQQFKVHKRLKWCGYSSWMGLGCVSYYTTRHVYNLLVA